MADTAQNTTIDVQSLGRNVEDASVGAVLTYDGSSYAEWQAAGGGSSSPVGALAPVRVATTEAITLSGLQTIDGVTLVDGDRVLVWLQSGSAGPPGDADNGVYVAHAGAWERAADALDYDAMRGRLVQVGEEGSAQFGMLFIEQNDGNGLTIWNPTIGTNWFTTDDPSNLDETIVMAVPVLSNYDATFFARGSLIQLRYTSAPADGDLRNSDLAIWSDDTAVHFKKKTSTGSIVTASIPLT